MKSTKASASTLVEESRGSLRELALFAGAGGGILGGRLLGWKCVCAVEIENYLRRVLLARQRDGILPRFPIWDDIRTFSGAEWRGRVDVVTGGFPCQDISCTGTRVGIKGRKSKLWVEMARVVGEVQPSFVLVENVPDLLKRGLSTVLGDLACLGYNARWGVLGSEATGAVHKRQRIWILAYPHSTPQASRHTSKPSEKQPRYGKRSKDEVRNTYKRKLPTAALFPRGLDGVANRLDRIKAVGNGQVPAVVELAWTILGTGITESQGKR